MAYCLKLCKMAKKEDEWIVYSIGGGDLRDDSGIINSEVVYKHKVLSDILEYCTKNGKTFWEYVEDCEGQKYGYFWKKYGML